jgi:hypothetical protein
MVERVARAIHESNDSYPPWETAPEWHEINRKRARAAIDAMEPYIREREDLAAETALGAVDYTPMS